MADSISTATGHRLLSGMWRFTRSALLAYLVLLLCMMLLENKLVYPVPPRSLGHWTPAWLGHEDVYFQSLDGTPLHGWFVPHEKPKYAILYCHGNGEHVAFSADLAQHLRDRLEASVFVFDYRGYGKSDGRPTESGCIADGLAAQRWLAERLEIEPSEIVIFGRSLGGAVAVALAAEQGAKALVLESTFPSLPAVAAHQYPWLPADWLMDNRYDSLARLAHYRGPLLQSHGTNDSLIPMALGRKLFDACPSASKRWIVHSDCDHNSPCPPDHYDELTAFLDAIR